MPCKELSASCKTVLLALEGYADYRDGTGAHPGEQNLSEAAGVDVRTVRRALAAGRALGLIQQTAAANPKAGKAAEYRLTLPAADDSSTGHASPVNNSTTGHVGPVNNSTVGHVSPVETGHHRTGMSFQPDTPVLSPKPYTNTQGLLRNSGTSPEPHIAEIHLDHPPAKCCPQHRGYRDDCGQCRKAWGAFKDWQAVAADHDVAIAAARDADRRRARQAIADCPDCDDFGRVSITLDDDGGRGEHLVKCDHPKTQAAQAVGYA
ncbi:helix-turn-helix domain-containing protein [Mycobacterium aquaticum]|nr:helix-turn-helix domain-containing protein [Mycobacterium aquaticum]